jgi:hypothetical protein
MDHHLFLKSILDQNQCVSEPFGLRRHLCRLEILAPRLRDGINASSALNDPLIYFRKDKANTRFYDLMSHHKQLEEKQMLASVFCLNYLTKTLFWMHKKTRLSFICQVQTLLSGRASLSLTSLGQHRLGKAKVRHKIKMVWRFLKNPRITESMTEIYKSLAHEILSSLDELIIAVDWSGCCGKENQLLRASLLFEGRSIVIYNEIHPEKNSTNFKVHAQFLKRLKDIIPINKKVTLVTDAGFKTPWFHSVSQQGWFYVGRVRGLIHCALDGQPWANVSSLFSQVKRGDTLNLGWGMLGEKSKTPTRGCFIAHFSEKKRRKIMKIRYPDANKKLAQMNSEPWILITNLHQHPRWKTYSKAHFARFCTNVYSKRMQIEQNFRDDKSTVSGLRWRFSRTRCPKKISVLILIASVTTLILWMIGFAAEKKNIHHDFQANTVKTHRVISWVYLAKQIIIHGFKKLRIRKFQTILHLFQLDYNQMLSLLYVQSELYEI